jgi:hypothetical protein
MRRFVGLPFFAREIFQTVEVVDPMRASNVAMKARPGYSARWLAAQ